MYAFVDESGDAGFRFAEGSSTHITFAAVIFRTRDALQQCEQRMDGLRASLGMARGDYFHFYTSHPRVRMALLEAIRNEHFEVLTYALDKRMLDPARIRQSKTHTAYLNLAIEAFEQFAHHLDAAVVALDGAGSRTFRRTVNSALRNAANRRRPGSIERVSLKPASRDPMLQLADYCAAIAQRHAMGDSQVQPYVGLLQPHWSEHWVDGERTRPKM